MRSPLYALAFWNVRVALAAALAALALLVLSLTEAIRLEPMPSAFAQPAALAVVQQGGGGRTPNGLIEHAVAAAPFTPSRTAPASSATQAPSAESFLPREIQLVGTVFGGSDGDSFALVSVDDAVAKVVRAGDRVGGYRLRSIAQGSAVFVRITDGERLQLFVPRSR